MERGRAWHLRLEAAFSREGQTEVRIRRGGVSARIDLLSDVPVEIKTGASPLGPDPSGLRPEWLEQVAMYCALLRRPTGRCVYVARPEAGPAGVRAFDIRFRDLDRLSSEIADREGALRDALGAGRSDGLPRCSWFGRGCEFQAAGVCDCTGAEAPGTTRIPSDVASITARPDLESRWSEAVAAVPAGAVPGKVARFRDLVYPRRTYFESLGPPEPETRPAPGFGPPDLYDRLIEALESGPAGEVADVAANGEGPEEEVVGWKGRPFLLRSSRAWSRAKPEEIGRRFPQYVLELGFRCAAAGRSDGAIVVGYERAESDRDRLQVLDVRFDSTEPWRAIWGDRASALAAARASSSPAGLPACPEWMYATCPYRGACACGDPETRSQR